MYFVRVQQIKARQNIHFKFSIIRPMLIRISFFHSRFTSYQAFKNVLKEIGDLAGQREVVAESLQIQVSNAITLLSKNLRDERKKALTEGSNLTQNLTAQVLALDRAKKNYEKAFRDSEKALENYQRADADLNLSRAEVEKQRHNMTIKSQQSDDAKNEYANQLQKTNKLQQQHYESALPEVSFVLAFKFSVGNILK